MRRFRALGLKPDVEILFAPEGEELLVILRRHRVERAEDERGSAVAADRNLDLRHAVAHVEILNQHAKGVEERRDIGREHRALVHVGHVG